MARQTERLRGDKPGADQGSLGHVGGLDFGFHNPFATVWGVLDHDDVLWLTGEHYESHRPLSYHITRLPRDVDWYADPSGANEIAKLRCAGFTVNKGVNALALGIAAVSACLENGIAASSPAPARACSEKPNSTATAPTPAAAAPRFQRTTITTPSATRLPDREARRAEAGTQTKTPQHPASAGEHGEVEGEEVVELEE